MNARKQQPLKQMVTLLRRLSSVVLFLLIPGIPYATSNDNAVTNKMSIKTVQAKKTVRKADRAQHPHDLQASSILADALQNAYRIEDNRVRAEALAVIAQAQAKAGAMEQARTTFAAALETARGIERSFDRAKTLVNIAKAQADAGNMAAALDIARSIQNLSVGSSVLTDVAKVQAQADAVEQARTTLATALVLQL